MWLKLIRYPMTLKQPHSVVFYQTECIEIRHRHVNAERERNMKTYAFMQVNILRQHTCLVDIPNRSVGDCLVENALLMSYRSVEAYLESKSIIFPRIFCTHLFVTHDNSRPLQSTLFILLKHFQTASFLF